ncbi:hypothetical protein ACFWAX_27745, partial [Streptomyces sp. NPDC059956]
MKKTFGIAVAVLVMAGTAGCSAGAVTQKAGESAQTMLAALASASDEASKAGSADISMTVTTPATGGKPLTVKGLYSWGNGRAMETEIPAKDLKMGNMAADGTITTRMVGGAYYYEVERMTSGPFKGKSWLKIEASAVMGEKGAAAMAGVQGDPTASLKGLKYAKDVTKVGSETVNGTSTVHYRAAIPTDKMGAAADIYGSIPLTGDVVTDIWVDAKGVPTRLNQAIGTTITVSVDFLSFGGNRTVEVPPAADTGDMTELYKQ